MIEQENPLGMIILFVFVVLGVVTYSFIKAVLQDYRERKQERLRAERRRVYEHGLADGLFWEEQARLDREHDIEQARKSIRKTCLAEHKLDGCRQDLLALPEPELERVWN